MKTVFHNVIAAALLVPSAQPATLAGNPPLRYLASERSGYRSVSAGGRSILCPAIAVTSRVPIPISLPSLRLQFELRRYARQRYQLHPCVELPHQRERAHG